MAKPYKFKQHFICTRCGREGRSGFKLTSAALWGNFLICANEGACQRRIWRQARFQENTSEVEGTGSE